MKNISEDQEFYIPHAGLDLDHYLEIYSNFSKDDLKEIKTNPKIRRIRQAIHHLSRYKWAYNFLKDKKYLNVLDVACGSGYGTYLLSESLPKLNFYGGDYDERAISFSIKKWGLKKNRKYFQFDLETWKSNIDDDLPTFDVLINFDTIEHLNHRDIFLVNCVENLSSNGTLLISTPCGHLNNILYPDWEYHKIEYSYRYLYNILRRFFNDVISPGEDNFFGNEFWNEKINSPNEIYLNKFNPLICKGPKKIGI